MALSEKSRSTLYQGFTTLLADEQAVEEMLSYFPARDVEEPATKEFIRAEVAELRDDTERMVRTTQAWTIGTMISVGGLVIATNAAFG